MCKTLLILISLFLLVACQQGNEMDLPQVPAGALGDSQGISAGRKLFAAHCAECHGRVAEGRTQRALHFDPPAPDFSEQRYRQVEPGYLYLRIARGRTMKPFNQRGSVMPPWRQHFRAEQIWNLVAYLRRRSLE